MADGGQTLASSGRLASPYIYIRQPCSIISFVSLSRLNIYVYTSPRRPFRLIPASRPCSLALSNDVVSTFAPPFLDPPETFCIYGRKYYTSAFIVITIIRNPRNGAGARGVLYTLYVYIYTHTPALDPGFPCAYAT